MPLFFNVSFLCTYFIEECMLIAQNNITLIHHHPHEFKDVILLKILHKIDISLRKQFLRSTFILASCNLRPHHVISYMKLEW